MVGQKSSTPTRAHNSLARRSPACLPATTLPSAWMAKAPGGTTCSLSGCGAASNTRRSICEPTKLSPRHEIRSAGILTFITDDDRIRALTTAPRINKRRRDLAQQQLHQRRQRDLLCGLQHSARLVLVEQTQLRAFELACHFHLSPSVSRTGESLEVRPSLRAASAGFQEKTAGRPTA